MPELPPLFERRYNERGAPPGTFVEPQSTTPARIRVLHYDAETSNEWEALEPLVLDVERRERSVLWIDVQGLGDGSAVRALGRHFGLHPLAVADAFNVGQRPKADEYDESTFVVLRSAHPGEDGDRIDWFQIALFVLDGVVITVGEHTSECLEPVRQRVRTGGSALRGGGADRLAAVVIDTVVDGYFPALEVLGDRLEVLEEQILEQPGRDVLRRLYRTKRDLVAFRRATWPLRDALHDICRTPGPHFGETVHHELRDTTDHVVQVVDLLESYRELASSLVDVHVSMLGQRTNESVRVLTVVSTIFIPLTFLAGVFGMNFDRSQPGNMPELGLPYGYVAFWLLCLALALALVLAFRRLGWLGRREREPDVE